MYNVHKHSSTGMAGRGMRVLIFVSCTVSCNLTDLSQAPSVSSYHARHCAHLLVTRFRLPMTKAVMKEREVDVLDVGGIALGH
jgi:hypothetical protein